jgi:hypothetical protein
MSTSRPFRLLSAVAALAAVASLWPGAIRPAAAQAKDAAESRAAARKNPHWQPPKTAWGHPDLEGIWTTDDMRGVPMARPEQRGTARDVDNARTGTFRNEEGSRDFGYTSMVIDPVDGRIPALTAAGRARRGGQGSFGVGPWEKVQDFSLYDRCITRGAVGSWMPAVYGNGARIVQTPDSVVISYEMVHDTRVIPLDNRPPLGDGIELWMGDARARFEGNTLVIESRNFSNRTNVGGARHSNKLRLTERLTRVDPQMIDYEIRVEDPDTFTKPFTMRLTVTQQQGYEIYEYGCHEGNNAMRNALSAERAYEKAAAEAAAKGLPAPERVFERVNGEDRAR